MTSPGSPPPVVFLGGPGVGYAEIPPPAALAPWEDSWSEPDDGGHSLLLPPRAAIARRLIEGWLSTSSYRGLSG